MVDHSINIDNTLLIIVFLHVFTLHSESNPNSMTQPIIFHKTKPTHISMFLAILSCFLFFMDSKCHESGNSLFCSYCLEHSQWILAGVWLFIISISSLKGSVAVYSNDSLSSYSARSSSSVTKGKFLVVHLLICSLSVIRSENVNISDVSLYQTPCLQHIEHFAAYGEISMTIS